MEGDWIEYYCREKLFLKVVDVAQNSGADAKWKFYEGCGLVLGGRSLEGISCLENLLPHSDFGIAAAHLSIIAHQSCETVDRDAVSQLEWKVEEGVGSDISERALQFAATALIHAGELDKARGYVERLLRPRPTSPPGLVLSGWLELAVNNRKAAARAFKTVLNQDKGNVDAALGEITCLASTDPSDAISRLNQLVVRYPKATPPLVEKMRLQLAAHDWSQALDTASRILSLEANNLAALELKALHKVVVEGDYSEGAVAVRRFGGEVEVQRGPRQLVAAAQLFSRVCGRAPTLLIETTRLASQASQSLPHCPAAMLELATQHRLAGRLTESAKLCKMATKIDETSTSALTALTTVQLAQTGTTQQVMQQVEFLTEVVGAEQSPELLLLRAQCEADHSLLDQAVALLHTSASGFSYGGQFLTNLNPELIMEIASHYPNTVEGLKKRVHILQEVVGICPGLAKALLALARTYFSLRDYTAATVTTRQLLSQVDGTNTEAHLIIAQIHLAQEEYEEANASLELGLSYNLQVRDWPLYHVLLGAILRYRGDTAACAHSMRTALSLNKGDHELSESELGTLYVELIASLVASGEAGQANQALVEAGVSLQGSGQEGRLAVAGAELAVLKGDYHKALALLANIQPDQPYFLQARKKMAEIHLEKMKDSRAFAECYKQLVSSNPCTENLILLGDAYMAIQEPELAVETYEKAVKGSGSDAKLSARLGRVVVRCHQYGRAIKCFRDAGLEGSLELAQLLMRLGQLEAAEASLADLQPSQKAMVLAKIREKAGDVSGAMKVIKEAREELGASEVGLNARMCTQLAEYAAALRDHDTAISYYKRALQYQPGDTRTEIALAKLYMQVNDWSACQSVCSTLLSRDPDNEPALLMLADLAYRRVDFTDAATHFSALLARRPDYWVALARLIEVKRRTAQLDDVQPFLQAAAASATPGDSGLSYCSGLYDWYSGNTNGALHHFNCARGDNEWGQQALHNMVELCLSGDEGVATATRLLAQMRPHSNDEESNVRLLHNLILLHSKDKQDIELAMADLTTLASQDTLRVGATLGLATGYVLQKQVARARNVLKRVAKAGWLVEEADYLERCWLLLADLHVQAGKNEPATEVLRRILAHNLSCHRAYELLALIAEKDQKYLEASLQYRQAWKLSGENDPALGFKLAFNQVKAKRYVDAITTCRVVLKINPEYPRIRKEILDKAISHLRT